MKEYILVLDDVPLGVAVNSIGHGVLIAHKQWWQQEGYIDWYLNSFKKVTCKVSQKEFDKAKSYDDFILVTESALGGREVAMVFMPREEYPKFFKFLRLFK